jgi:hypothetical protein
MNSNPGVDGRRRFSYFRQINWSLLALASVALLIRVWGIWNADSGDEINEVFEALRVSSGQLNYERWFKRFYLYVLAVEYGVYYVAGWTVGLFASPLDFAAKIIRDVSPLFLIARVTSAIAGTASVILVYQIGRRLYDRKTGLIAAIFLCFNAVNIELSHYARVDATLCAVVLLTFYWIVCIFKQGDERRLRYYSLAGLFMGIAIQNKSPAIALIFPFFFAHLVTVDFTISPRALLNRNMLAAGVCLVIGLMIGNPAVIFAPVKFLQGLVAVSDNFTTAINETRSEQIGYLVYLLYFFREFGLPLSIFVTYSLGRALFGRQKDDLLVLSFAIPFFGAMGASRYMVSDSYMIPLMPFLYLLCSRYLVLEVKRIDSGRWANGHLVWLAMLVLIAYPVAKAGQVVVSFSGQNTRYLAKNWIESNISAGSKVLMDSGKTINSSAPMIAENKESILRTIAELEEKMKNGTLKDPTRMVDQNAITYFKMLLQTVPNVAYDITSTKFGLEVHSVDQYRDAGYQYFIISENMKSTRTEKYAKEIYPEVASFYSSLDTDPRLKLVKEIGPTATNRGDTFFVYKVL